MQEFSELGAGFRLAAADLEIRGAGELLGSRQHGLVTVDAQDLVPGERQGDGHPAAAHAQLEHAAVDSVGQLLVELSVIDHVEEVEVVVAGQALGSFLRR